MSSDRKVFRVSPEAAAKIEAHARDRSITLAEAADRVILQHSPLPQTVEGLALAPESRAVVASFAAEKGIPEGAALDTLVQIAEKRRQALKRYAGKG